MQARSRFAARRGLLRTPGMRIHGSTLPASLRLLGGENQRLWRWPTIS